MGSSWWALNYAVLWWQNWMFSSVASLPGPIANFSMLCGPRETAYPCRWYTVYICYTYETLHLKSHQIIAYCSMDCFVVQCEWVWAAFSCYCCRKLTMYSFWFLTKRTSYLPQTSRSRSTDFLRSVPSPSRWCCSVPPCPRTSRTLLEGTAV